MQRSEITDVRRQSWLVVLLIVAHVVLVAMLAMSLIVGNVHHVGATLGGSALSPEATVWVWLGADVLIVALLSWFYESAQRARWGLRYLGSAEYVTLMAMSEASTTTEDAIHRDRDAGTAVGSLIMQSSPTISAA